MTIAQHISHFTDHVVDTAGVIPSEVEEAIRTLLRWVGDDPGREGLVDTPKRVAEEWREYCKGYEEDPAVHLEPTFADAGGYLAIYPFYPIANTIWLRSSVKRISRIFGEIALSEFLSSLVYYTAMRAASKFKNVSQHRLPTVFGPI
jgi:hypothetical protein